MNHQLSSEERAALAEDIPAGRFADPDEVADLAWQIINSPEYMTGPSHRNRRRVYLTNVRYTLLLFFYASSLLFYNL